MCGIIGVTGVDEAFSFLVEGLRQLEYRGYDSAGVALVADGDLWLAREADGNHSVEELALLETGSRVVGSGVSGSRTGENSGASSGASSGAGDVSIPPPRHCEAGIGHTRWATHGRPTVENAHPHVDCSGRLALVHNGIIENHAELAARLDANGHEIASETDSEVLVHVIEEELRRSESLLEAVRRALEDVRGSFAIAVVSSAEPGVIVAARRVSPLIFGVDERSAVLASDIPALLGTTRNLFALEDDQIVELRPGVAHVSGLDGSKVDPVPLTITWDLDAARKDGFDDFMTKEIHEQPRAVAETLLDRHGPGGSLVLDELRLTREELRLVDKVFIVACGSSYHAALVAKYAIEHWTRVPVEVDIASEFRYRDPVLDQRTLAIGVSQSGETVDTLQAMREAKRWGARVIAVSNVVDSSMTREADGVLYTRAGPEICVASTKTYLAQVAALEVLALALAEFRQTLDHGVIERLVGNLNELPAAIEECIDREKEVFEVADRILGARDFFYLGRNVGYPAAMEGALKLKELSYLRAEAYAAGELKHGPIALIEPGTVVVGIATRNRLREKMLANVAEVRSRGATVVLVANDGERDVEDVADHVLWVPEVEPLLSPVVNAVPLQLFAYRMARELGYDVDRPRNLAKTVTVE